MKKDFCLSDKEMPLGTLLNATLGTKIYYPEDVKEFIRQFKDKFDDLKSGYTARDIWFEINKLAGDKLI